MDSEIYRVVRRPLLTEKNMRRTESRREYTFDVDPRANKVEIRQAIEKLYDVKVIGVNTITKKGLERRMGLRWSKGSDSKKAIVKLAEGEKIDLI